MKAGIINIVFALAAFAAISSSCRKTIPYNPPYEGSMLVLNAQWYTTDTLHHVYLCRSTRANVEDVEEGLSLKCYVNGELVCEPDTSWIMSRETGLGTVFHSRCFPVKAFLSPGDEVTLRAVSDSSDLTASAIVLPPPDVVVDTSSVYVQDAAFHDRIYSFDVRLKDAPGTEDYYRAFSLQAVSHSYWMKDDIQPADTVYQYSSLDESDPVFKSVPIQLPGVSLVNGSNKSHVFSDELFSGGEYLFHFNLEDHRFVLSGRSGKERTVPEVYIRMAAITKDTFLYCLASNSLDYGSFGSLTEPPIVHENVSGGMGYFGIYSISEHHIFLHECIVEKYNW